MKWYSIDSSIYLRPNAIEEIAVRMPKLRNVCSTNERTFSLRSEKNTFFERSTIKSWTIIISSSKTSNLEFSLHKSAPLVYVSLSAVVLPTFAIWAFKLWKIIKCFWNFSDCYMHSMLRNSQAKLHTTLLTLIMIFFFHVFFQILIYFF